MNVVANVCYSGKIFRPALIDVIQRYLLLNLFEDRIADRPSQLIIALRRPCCQEIKGLLIQQNCLTPLVDFLALVFHERGIPPQSPTDLKCLVLDRLLGPGNSTGRRKIIDRLVLRRVLVAARKETPNAESLDQIVIQADEEL